MKTNIIITKVWEDEFSAEFNIKFETTLNNENFEVSGNFYLSENDFKKLTKELNKSFGNVVFGLKENLCELSISSDSRGCKNINYHLILDEQTYGIKNSFDISINTGYIIEPAVIDRILPRLKNFYNEPVSSRISLIYDEV